LVPDLWRRDGLRGAAAWLAAGGVALAAIVEIIDCGGER
jgi:hypothetical protein